MTRPPAKATGHAPARAARQERVLLDIMHAAARRAPALATLNPVMSGDFTNALIAAWSRVLGVLGFYQDRIADEGYLETAVESVSLRYLAGQIGAAPRPACGAETWLSVQLAPPGKKPDGMIVAPGQSLVVQNVPEGGSLPVVFEADDTAELRSAWNAIAPAPAIVAAAPRIWSGCRSVRVAGVETGIRPGQALLLEAPPPPGAPAGPAAWLVMVDNVYPDRRAGATLITWSDPVDAGAAAAWPRTLTGIVSFRKTTGLLGRTAPAWADVTEQTKREVGVAQGGLLRLDLPLDGPSLSTGLGPWRNPAATGADAAPLPGMVQALAAGAAGVLFAGTDRGLFRTDDAGGHWRAAPLPHGRHSVSALHRTPGGRLYAGTTTGVVFASLDDGASWTALPNAVATPVATKKLFPEMLRFVGAEKEEMAQWTLEAPIHAIVEIAGLKGDAATLVIGTDQGVFAMPVNGLAWRPCNKGMPGEAPESGAAGVGIAALAAIHGDMLVAAMGARIGVAKMKADVAAWTLVDPWVPHGILTCFASDPKTLFVGSTEGVIASHRARHWEPFTAGLGTPAPAVYALAAASGRLWAATDAGILASPLDRAAWSRVDVQELDLFVADSVLAAGLDDGTVSPMLRARFRRFGIDLAPTVDVLPLAGPVRAWELREQAADGATPRLFRVYADAPAPAGDVTAPWLRIAQWLYHRTGPGMRLAYGDGRLYAVVPRGPVLNDDWPELVCAGNRLMLDRRVDPPAAGSELVVVGADHGLVANPVRYPVEGGEVVQARAFGRTALVTRVAIRGDASLAAIDPRVARVFLASDRLQPFAPSTRNPAPLAGDRLVLAGTHSDLEVGRMLQVSGPRPAAIVLASTPPLPRAALIAHAPAEAAPALDQATIAPALSGALLAAGVKLSAAATAACIDPGALWLLRDGDQAWRIDAQGPATLAVAPVPIVEVAAAPAAGNSEWVVESAGRRVTFPAVGARLLWQSATSTQRPVSDVAQIAEVALDPAGEVTHVRLAAPLANVYDPAAARVCANLVHASQGETVTGEIVGGGSGLPAQQLALHRAPLTYRTGHGESPAPALLRIAVDAQLTRSSGALGAIGGTSWHPAESLARAGPADRVFRLRTDDQGKAHLQFGDGIHGARLPLGTDNVSATYRTGAGASGNVPAGALHVLRKRPAGIRAVTNPLPAAGGADIEPLEALRRRAPLALRHGGGIVTLDDYRSFALGYHGIGSVAVDFITDPIGSPFIRITATDAQGRPIDADPGLRAALDTAIRARRADRTNFAIVAPATIRFRVVLTVAAQPGAAFRIVARDVAAALIRRFATGRPISAPIGRAELLAVARSVEGVARAAIEVLEPVIAAEGSSPPAFPAPRELHLLAASDGVFIRAAAV